MTPFTSIWTRANLNAFGFIACFNLAKCPRGSRLLADHAFCLVLIIFSEKLKGGGDFNENESV